METHVLIKDEEGLNLELILDQDEIAVILDKGSLEDYNKEMIFNAIKAAKTH